LVVAVVVEPKKKLTKKQTMGKMPMRLMAKMAMLRVLTGERP
jgi:hypothetical protein